MVEKPWGGHCMYQRQFESSVNSYGRKTYYHLTQWCDEFESSVNSYGRKMTMLDNAKANKFESSVNLYGRKT